MKYQINWIRFWAGLCFFVEQNNYFGWNAVPHSDAELIADGICLLIGAMAWEKRA